MELVLTGAALSGAHAPLNRRCLSTLGAKLDQISHYRVRPHVEDFWTITRSQYRVKNLDTSQLLDNQKIIFGGGELRSKELRRLDRDEHGVAYGPP